jgi:hypothetical protein
MKRLVILIAMIWCLNLFWAQSMLWGQYKTGKAHLNLGIVNGASVGLRWTGESKENREYFTNAMYLTIDSFWSAGINHEIRFLHSKDWYTLATIGLDYYQVEEIFGDPGGGNSQDAPNYRSFILPHATVGAGYQFALNENVNLYVECDLGLKFSLINLNIGLSYK